MQLGKKDKLTFALIFLVAVAGSGSAGWLAAKALVSLVR